MTRIRKPWPGELDASGEIIDHEIEPPMRPRQTKPLVRIAMLIGLFIALFGAWAIMTPAEMAAVLRAEQDKGE